MHDKAYDLGLHSEDSDQTHLKLDFNIETLKTAMRTNFNNNKFHQIATQRTTKSKNIHVLL